MALKPLEQRQREKAWLDKYNNPFGAVMPDVTKLLVIYARQSTSKQVVENVYSAEQQRDGLLRYAKDTLKWKGSVKLLIENDLATKTSGRLPTDSRPGLKTVLEYVESGECSAVLAVDVSRLFRDEDMIESAVFVNICKDHEVMVITLGSIYDFNHPQRKDKSRFVYDAEKAGSEMSAQSKKMRDARTDKAELKGFIANGEAPIGMSLVRGGIKGRDHTLRANDHTPYLLALFTRFQELGADLTALHNEIIGRPVFPDTVEDIDPSLIRLTRVTGGWTIKNRSGLRHILTNPAYVGHLQFNGVIAKYNAWDAVIPLPLWEYAFSHLSKVNLDGSPNDKERRTARYARSESSDYGALLYGVRDNGRPVIDGISESQHVYVQIGKRISTKDRKAAYVIKDFSQMNTSFYVGSISVEVLDHVIEVVLTSFGVERTKLGRVVLESDKQEPQSQPTRLQRTIAETQKALDRVERRFRVYEDSMTDTELAENRASKRDLENKLDKLLKRQREEDLIRAKQQQAIEDIQVAQIKWNSWTLDHKRSLIRLTTRAITLECIADGWFRLTIDWKPFVAETLPDGTLLDREVVYLQRDTCRLWTPEEINVLKRMYSGATRDDILKALPNRSWQSIKDKANTSGLSRKRFETHELPDDVTITDIEIMQRYGLDGLAWGRRSWYFADSSQQDGLS